MDWNRDGQVNGHDMVHFHEVISNDNNTATGSGNANASDFGLGWTGKAMLALLVIGFISFVIKLFS